MYLTNLLNDIKNFGHFYLTLNQGYCKNLRSYDKYKKHIQVSLH